jgi:hypothetical protein
MKSCIRSYALCVAICAIHVAGCGARPGPEPAAPAAPAAAAEPAAPAPAEQPEEKPTRLPSEILSGEDKAWVFSFEGSAAYDKAKANCDERFNDDPAGRAKCITKARDTFTADAMEFTRDDKGNDVWVIYRTKSNKLYGAQDNDTVSIKKLGNETGKPVLFSGVSEFKVKLGGEYSLEMEDPHNGTVAYDARLGFIAK